MRDNHCLIWLGGHNVAAHKPVVAQQSDSGGFLWQVGVQEKVGFVVAAKGLSGAGLYSGAVRLPAAIEVFLVLTGLFVMWHHLAGSTTDPASDATTGLLPTDETEVA